MWKTQSFSNFNSFCFGYFNSGVFGVQSFLVVGGFLAAYLQMKQMDSSKESSLVIFVKGTVSRYIRFSALLALTVLIHATWLYRLGSGPFWDRINFTERQFCRENGWTNLLFLDNYINSDHKCLIHTWDDQSRICAIEFEFWLFRSWYLSTDFWLRIAVTGCIVLFYKKPSLIYKIFAVFIIVSAVILSVTVYENKLEAIAFFSPE
jgi:peptidoglycan/LPS O-acetylase OafA/YrhL